MTLNPNSPRKKVIEVALPLEAINVASARENYIYKGNPSAIHKWWAQRPLAAARAVIFASLVDDPDNPDALHAFVEACKQLPIGANVKANGDTPRMRLFDFIERMVTWEATTDEVILNTARKLILIATEGNPPPFLDPFAGGGTIPIEGQRLGLKAYASDLNPIPILINKALIEIPPRFVNQSPVNPHHGVGNAMWKASAGLADDIRFYGRKVGEVAGQTVKDLYPQHNNESVVVWLWARTVKSPNPAVKTQVPLVRSFTISSKKGEAAWIEPKIDPDTQTISFIVRTGDKSLATKGTIGRNGGTCLISGEPIPLEHIRSEGQAGRLGSKLLAIMTISGRTKTFYSPDEMQENVALNAHPDWQPEYELSTHPQYMAAPRYGMNTIDSLFTNRQLVAINAIGNALTAIRREILSDALQAGLVNDNVALDSGGSGALAYSEAVYTYLVFALAKHLPYGCSLVPWYAEERRPSWLFGRQAIPMVWDYAEVNPFSDIGGSFTKSVQIIAESIEPIASKETGIVQQENASTKLIISNALISTDPPYYDNVPYADLSDFFYVWHRKFLKTVFPRLFTTVLVPKDEELVADQYRYGGKEQAEQHFIKGITKTFQLMRQGGNQDYPVTIYYAFKQLDGDNKHDLTSKGWETILDATTSVGFTISGTWPMRTERSGRLRDSESNALASSIVLVCRPRPENAPTISRRQFVDALRRELPAALKNMQSGNIAPVDLAQASIGPGMAIYSRYSAVLEADGTPMAVRAALGLINQELDTHLAEQDGDLDGDTRFAVAWFEQFGFNEGEFGQADTLARAKNTSVAGVEAAGLVKAARGKVKLVHWTEYDAGNASVALWNPQQDKRPTVWEATHHLIERLNSHGEAGSALLMTTMPPEMAAGARTLAYRLYSICERKGWADHARDYNALVISWAEIGEQAVRVRDEQAAGEATQQNRLFE